MSKTQENLLKAFAGESMARNKYTTFAKEARKEGFEWIARVFEETADNERAHAEEELEHIKDKTEVANTLRVGATGKTIDNLKAAAEGEKFETDSMYPEMKTAAAEENETTVADLFADIAEVEAKHQARYEKLAQMLEDGSLYKKTKEIGWKCLNCGYIHKGTEAPSPCPLCKKPQGYYMTLDLLT